jgi:hypothetical protein
LTEVGDCDGAKAVIDVIFIAPSLLLPEAVTVQALHCQENLIRETTMIATPMTTMNMQSMIDLQPIELKHEQLSLRVCASDDIRGTPLSSRVDSPFGITEFSISV